MVELKVKVTFDEEVLGTANSNPDIHRKYIAENAENSEKVEEEVSSVVPDETAEETFEKAVTIFSKNSKGEPIVWDYQWKGYFKDIFKTLRKIPKTKCAAIKNYKQEIDGLVFIFPRQIPIDLNDGEIGICQRPLRASTPQGERVALASSESIPVGSSMIFTIQLLNPGDEKAIIEALNYGRLRGFGQWRNSGKGRFHYEILDRTETEDLF